LAHYKEALTRRKPEDTEIPTPAQFARKQMPDTRRNDRSIFVLGALLGICAGWLDVKVGDLVFTALFVLASTMLLGALSPRRPWRWTLVVAVFVPVVQLLAYLLLNVKPFRAQIYESFLGFLTGIAGAYGGSAGRRGLNELFGK
jgi:hypothetical protein